jgi:prolipoprotein diacylglyceryltransferase
MKFIKDPGQFFIMSEFNFSIFWAMFGFWLVLYILTRLEKSNLLRYIDGIVLSFLFIMVVWYIGAIFWGQVYWRETMIWIEILYKHPHSIVASQVPIFPLPIVYTLMSFIIFSGMYILSLFVHIRWYIGYIGLILFGAMILIFESFSGKQDVLSVSSVFNLPQVFALILIVWSWYQFSQIFKDESNKETHIDE